METNKYNKKSFSYNWRGGNSHYNQYSETKFNNDNIQNNNPYNKALTSWGYRYGKNGLIRPNIIREDEEFYQEHLEHVRKNKTFDFNLMGNVKLKIYFKNSEITNSKEIENFADLNFNKILLSNIEQLSFQIMTPIQRAVVPFIISNNDVMGCSQTGSGKTIAFLSPIINKIISNEPPEEDEYLQYGVSAPICLILVPTRELAEQIFKEARKLTFKTGISVVKVYGGVGYEYQINDIESGCDILVATPGRLIDFIKRGKIKLNSIKYLVIDEADRILDMGFEEQLKSIIYDYDMNSKEKRQNLLFSATFSQDIRYIASEFMNDYYFITNNNENSANENIEQNLIFVNDENEKILKLHEILQKIKGSVIIFLDTKRGVDSLNNFLIRANYNSISIHGDKHQAKRLEAINKFKNGDVPILIATDVASRGIDFPNVSYVFNFDMPTNIDDYIHRIGRTGRCGNKGKAVSFISDNSKPILKDLYKLLIKLNQEIPDWFTEFVRKNENDKNNYDNYKRRNNYNNNRDKKSYSNYENDYKKNYYDSNDYKKHHNNYNENYKNEYSYKSEGLNEKKIAIEKFPRSNYNNSK